MSTMFGTRRQQAGVWTVGAALLLMAGSTVTAHAITAPPPKDCNTPNATGGTGVLQTPQTPGNPPPLTKTLSNTISQPGSTTYQFTLSTTRTTTSDSGSGASVTYTANTVTDSSKAWTVNQWTNASVSANGGTATGKVASNTATTLTLAANWGTTPAAGSPFVISFFSELLDCAWDVTTGGNSTTANYATQQNTPTFTSGGALTIALDVNNSDAICDRVEVKGTTPAGVPFTDYSNLVGSPNGTSCTLQAVTPEVPATALVVVIGGAAILGFIYIRRRTGRTIRAA